MEQGPGELTLILRFRQAKQPLDGFPRYGIMTAMRMQMRREAQQALLICQAMEVLPRNGGVMTVDEGRRRGLSRF